MAGPTAECRRRHSRRFRHRRRPRPWAHRAAWLTTSPPVSKRIMAMSSKRILMVGVALCALAGCDTTRPIGSDDVAFGEAVKYDNALQVINPAPVYAAD